VVPSLEAIVTYVELACRVLLGTVFAVSGLSKVTGRASFSAYARSVRRLGSLRKTLVRPVAVAFVTAELATVALLAIPLAETAAIGFMLAGGLLVVFCVAIAASLRRGERTACRCFGASTAQLGWRHVVRNVILLGVALAGLLGALGAVGPAPATLAGLAVAGIIGLILGWLITEIDHFAELFGPTQLSVTRRPS
jgi:hypothetical protein